MSGRFSFVPLSRAWRSRQSVACSHLLSMRSASQAWLHHTRIAVQSSPLGRVQRTTGVPLGDLARRLFPPTVLCNRLAERHARARSCQARGRGSTRKPGVTIAISQTARAGVQSRGKAQGPKAWAPLGGQRRSVRTTSRVLAQGSSPGVAREARGAPALLSAVRRNRARAKAVLRLRMAETARAR
jgi:hypothetical protein